MTPEAPALLPVAVPQLDHGVGAPTGNHAVPCIQSCDTVCMALQIEILVSIFLFGHVADDLRIVNKQVSFRDVLEPELALKLQEPPLVRKMLFPNTILLGRLL